MKNLLMLLMLTASTLGSAQNTTEKQLGDFTTVKVYDLINLIMIQSDENKLTITGKNKDDVVIVNKDGKLKIRMNTEESFDGSNTDVTLYYKNIDVIDANEGAEVLVRGTIEQYEIDLKTQEGAEITANLKTKYANFRAVTGGIINVTGSSETQDISIYTGGKFNGEDLTTEHTEVNVNAAGEAYVNASKKAKVKIKAGGDVYIYGDPQEVDESRVLGGRIKRM